MFYMLCDTQRTEVVKVAFQHCYGDSEMEFPFQTDLLCCSDKMLGDTRDFVISITPNKNARSAYLYDVRDEIT